MVETALVSYLTMRLTAKQEKSASL